MMCNKCQSYGHTQKWCKNNALCRRYGSDSHEMAQCEAEVPACYHCKSDHAAGRRVCKRQEKEEVLVNIQESEKVHIMRARQIMQRDNEYVEVPRKVYSTHFDCEISEDDKRKFTPWLLEKCICNVINSKPKSIRSRSKTVFTIEITTAQESKIIERLTNINGIQLKTSINKIS